MYAHVSTPMNRYTDIHHTYTKANKNATLLLNTGVYPCQAVLFIRQACSLGTENKVPARGVGGRWGGEDTGFINTRQSVRPSRRERKGERGAGEGLAISKWWNLPGKKGRQEPPLTQNPHTHTALETRRHNAYGHLLVVGSTRLTQETQDSTPGSLESLRNS